MHRSAGGMGRIGKGKIGMPKSKKARPKEGLRTPTVTATAEEAGPSSPSSQRTAGQPAAPPSPGKQLRLEAGRSVRKLKGAYIRAARRFFKAEQLWDEQQDTHERLVASAEKRAKKAHPKGALRLAVAAQAECSLQVKLHHQHGIWTDIIKETWQADAALLQREKELLQLQVQMLQRRVRRVRMGALR